MNTYFPQDKIEKSLARLSTHALLIVSDRIQNECIMSAKSDKTKKRLVNLATYTAFERGERFASQLQTISWWVKFKNWMGI